MIVQMELMLIDRGYMTGDSLAEWQRYKVEITRQYMSTSNDGSAWGIDLDISSRGHPCSTHTDGVS
jgi:hypothetical protein